jgi:hypothetical protein
MITAEEKAQQLIKELQMEQLNCGAYRTNMNLRVAKRSAIILCDQMIEFEHRVIQQLDKITKDAGGQFKCEQMYWEDVKSEIEKL